MQEANNYQPRFIISQDPGRFGGQQEDYLRRANSAIEDAAAKICVCRQTKGDLKEHFHVLIRQLSLTRAQIAKDHHTQDAERFGFRRDAYYPGCRSTLGLGGVYEKYNRKLLTLFSTYLKSMESNGIFVKKELVITDKCDERISKLQIRILNLQDIEDQGYTKDPQDYLPDDLKDVEKLIGMDLNAKEIGKYHQKFRRFKKEAAQDYRTRKIACVIQIINSPEYCPSPESLGLSVQTVRAHYPKEVSKVVLGNRKSMYVHVLLRTEVDGDLYAMTDYITWMYEKKQWVQYKCPEHHPIKRMTERSKVMLLHQDEYLIEKTLEEIAKVFERAAMWDRNSQDLQALKDIMALFCYLSAHNIRDVRGSAAETEWLECAIYESLKVEAKYDKERMVDLEAFANPLFSQFKKAYCEMVELTLK